MKIRNRPHLLSGLFLGLAVAACGQNPADNGAEARQEMVSRNETLPAAPPAPAAQTANNAAADSEVMPDDKATKATPDDETVRGQYSPELARCLDSGDAAKGVSVAMGGCFHQELKMQDERLNAAYRSAMSKRDASGQAQLRAEERAWIKERDETCNAARTGGTIDLVQIPQCLLEETVRRRIELQPMAG